MPGPCARCGQEVFAAEERLALSTRFHVRCFTCAICSRTLDSYNLAENRELNEIFCKTCYRLNFATKGYGYGGNEPTLLALPKSREGPPPISSSSTSSSVEARIDSGTLPTHQQSKFLDETKLNKIPPPPPLPRNLVRPPFLIQTKMTPRVQTDQIIPQQQQQQQQRSSPLQNNNLATTIRTVQASHKFKKNYHQQNKFNNNNPGINPNVATTTTTPSTIITTMNYQNAQRTNTATCLTGNQCTIPSLPRYPPKQSKDHRIPLNADSYRHGIHKSVEKNYTHHQAHGLKSTDSGNQASSTAATGKRHHLGGGELCRRCHKPVYWAEMKLGYHGVYHVECFCCCCCGKPLESTTVSENQGEIFCTGCYRRFFGTHGIGFGIGAGVLQTP